MTMMFEVADLAVASPATVSRCGMVYLEPGVLGLDPFINCWIKRLPELAKPFEDNFRQLFGCYVLPAIEFVRNNLKEILTSVDSALLIAFLRLMDLQVGPFGGPGQQTTPGAAISSFDGGALGSLGYFFFGLEHRLHLR
ncbi:hypothetical protein JTB14_033742 [Gonioctena quinquepunctata]|nr:hypothetical protein JTB14_033742 [Gonioctena quinquepunctata]